MDKNNINISIIKEEFSSTPMENTDLLISKYINDKRKSVQKLIESRKKQLKKYEAEVLRIKGMKEFDNSYSGSAYICGIDEVGRGPLAGPVVTAAVIMPKESEILYVNDSKKLSKAKREELAEIIQREAVSISFGILSPKVIDELNIYEATKKAMSMAVEGLKVRPDELLIDAMKLDDIDIPQQSIIKGDAKSYSIACASIVAKVKRDRMMEEYANQYPGYRFERNSGYGTAEHIEALKSIGPCDIHRRSFIKGILQESKNL